MIRSIWVTVELLAVCQGPYVVKRSYIKRNRGNFYFLKNTLLFGFFFNFKFVLPGKFWPCHGNYLTISELFCTQGRDVGRAGQSCVLNSALSSPVTLVTYRCSICSSLLLLCTLLWIGYQLPGYLFHRAVTVDLEKKLSYQKKHSIKN